MPSGSLISRGGFTLSHLRQVCRLSPQVMSPILSITDRRLLFASSSTPSTLALDYSRVANPLRGWR